MRGALIACVTNLDDIHQETSVQVVIPLIMYVRKYDSSYAFNKERNFSQKALVPRCPVVLNL